jgi:hypothetical protein
MGALMPALEPTWVHDLEPIVVDGEMECVMMGDSCR